MQTKWMVEIDEYCQRVLEKHWPEVERFGNVGEVGKHNLATVDLIAGGFPCQPHSVAGKRKGAADDRNLWPEFSRIIAELRPRYVIAENVLGIISTYLDTVLSDLESQGYTCGTFNIPAVAFDAPHRRERIFIVAHTRRGISQASGDGENQRRTSASAASGEFGIVADASISGLSEPARGRVGSIREAQGECEGSEPCRGNTASGTYWTTEPSVGRVANGVPSRVDRLRGLGNAVVPQVAEWIGCRILENENKLNDERSQ
jgi:DNA (cytosine-5)-methyltransferase 1